jgi:uncharacterized membrane protein YecN with MAPEG domain
MLAIIYVLLSVVITRQRVKHRVPLGAGNSLALERALRVCANFAEYVPVAHVLMFACELNMRRTRTVAINGAVLTCVIGVGLAAIKILHYALTTVRLES